MPQFFNLQLKLAKTILLNINSFWDLQLIKKQLRQWLAEKSETNRNMKSHVAATSYFGTI